MSNDYKTWRNKKIKKINDNTMNNTNAWKKNVL